MSADMSAEKSLAAPLESLALYVHWPWCLSKCPYCDFNSHARAPADSDQKTYREAILRELDHYAEQTKGRPLGSVFFGGGTPSLMSPDTVEAIIEAARHHWGLQNGCEITIEANPTSIEAAKFRAFREAGVNRVSVGVQALNDADLQALGREHSVDEALRALDIASAVFERFTFDLIYARPGQGQGDWANELERALALAGDHLSLYQLTIEPGTAFFRQNVGEVDQDLGADLYEITQEMCEEAGLPAYEVSNHARVGQESRHNMTYWQGGDYIGIGPGAHGRLSASGTTRATHQMADPARWLAAVARDGHATAKVRELGPRERLEELVLSGLRLTDGIDARRFARQSGQELTQALNTDALFDLQTAQLIDFDGQRLAATAAGRLMLNTLITRLLDEPHAPSKPD
jgi:oxygen-independent coproporphyrinogen-3 oxidase